VHIERRDVGGAGPGDVGALVVNGQRPTFLPRGKAKRKLLADFTVGESDNVGRIGVDTAECHDLDVEAGFFLDLAYGRLFDGLPDVVPAAR
jgi:hypothetical protein